MQIVARALFALALTLITACGGTQAAGRGMVRLVEEMHRPAAGRMRRRRFDALDTSFQPMDR